MTIAIAAEPVPLKLDSHGTYRVGDSEVRLDSVLYWHNHGTSPEDILKHFPTLELADIYSVIGYYLSHRTEIDAYLLEREQSAAALRAEMERAGRVVKNTGELGARLVERWNARSS